MKNYTTNIIKLLFYKKKYIGELCNDYGNPQGVRDHLQFIANKYRIFSKFLRKDIEKFNKEVEELFEQERLIQEYLHERQGGCYDCPMGNGEGGCTIPGYCIFD